MHRRNELRDLEEENRQIREEQELARRQYEEMIEEAGSLEIWVRKRRVAEAAQSQNIDAVLEMLAQGYRVDSQGPDGNTALHWVAWFRLDSLLSTLLEKRARPDIGNQSGECPVHWAAKAANVTALDAMTRGNRGLLSVRDCDGFTAFIISAQTDNAPVMEWMYLKGISVEEQDDWGRTALQWACYKGNRKTVQWLLSRSASIVHRDHEGMTAIHWAALKGHEQVAEMLLDVGAVELLDVPDAAGDTPVALAMRKKNRYLVMSFHKCQVFQFLIGRPHLSQNHFANLFLCFIIFNIIIYAFIVAPGIAARNPDAVMTWAFLMGVSLLFWVQNCYADPGWLMPRTVYPQHFLLGEDPSQAFDAEQPVESQMVHCDAVMQDLGEGERRELMKLEMEQNKYNYQRQLIREARKRLEEGCGLDPSSPAVGAELQPLIGPGGDSSASRKAQLERAAMTLHERERATGENLGRARIEHLLSMGCGEYLTLVEKGDFKQVCVVCRARRKMRSHHCKECGRCVDRLDHHCPWIDNCVGLGNQRAFFCFIVVLFVTIADFYYGVFLYAFDTVFPEISRGSFGELFRSLTSGSLGPELQPIIVILTAVFDCIWLVFVGALVARHTAYMMVNVTTYEVLVRPSHVQRRFPKNRGRFWFLQGEMPRSLARPPPLVTKNLPKEAAFDISTPTGLRKPEMQASKHFIGTPTATGIFNAFLDFDDAGEDEGPPLEPDFEAFNASMHTIFILEPMESDKGWPNFGPREMRILMLGLDGAGGMAAWVLKRCKINPSTLVDVALDLGRPPLLHERDAKGSMRRREVTLGSSAVLTQAELDAIAGHELLEGRWSSDDRSGVSGTLHRVCRNIDSLDSSVVGITIRMARPMYHMTRHIQELQEILRNKNSLLVLGPPGSGKTTLLREITREHDEGFDRRVWIVDTSSEIAGFAKVCHPSVGRWTRRKLVAKRERQHQDMLETVQNHTPEVLVIDEIGSREEVEAASSIGFRGVALVATAHARSLKDAMDNPTLQPLFGGFADSTVSDETMRRTGRGKNLRERKGEPVFKSLVELSDVGDQWRIYPSVADAVDATLANNPPRSVLADASFQGRSRPSRKAFFTATTETSSPGDVDAEAKRRKETSGRAYRLCFDGGVHSTGRPGGAGALLRRLRARTGKAIKRPAAEWMLCTQQPTSAPQMEYAALLIGLRGTLDILHRLQPKPLSIFIEGDCRFVVERHQGSQPVPIQHEHPEVARKLQQFTVLVDEAVESLREQGVEVGCLWRRRGRNRAADRLAQEARRRRRDDLEERCFSQDERHLLLFEPHLIPTRWHIQEVHPCLRLERVSQGVRLAHPQQPSSAGFMGLKLTPFSADGSFSFTVQVEGWAGDSSFLLGITPSSAPSFNEAQAFTACEIGYWISPKSGRVFGPDNTNFILPSLRAHKGGEDCGHLPEFRRPEICARCRSESIADPQGGTRWTLTYKRGTLEIFFAAPNGAAESLGAVSLGVHEARASGITAGILTSLPLWCLARHDLFERASKVGRELVTQWDWRVALQKALLSIKSKDKFWLQQLLSERRGRHWRMISDRIPWLADEGSQQSSDNLCVGHDSFKEQFNISGASPGVLVKDSMLLHPCQASGCKWVLLNTDQRAVAVRPAGTWRSKTSFMIGFIDASQSLSQLEGKHPADVGYFFSPSSRSVLGKDGTNFALPDCVDMIWLKQLAEEGSENAKIAFERADGHSSFQIDERMSWCVKLAEHHSSPNITLFVKPHWSEVPGRSRPVSEALGFGLFIRSHFSEFAGYQTSQEISRSQPPPRMTTGQHYEVVFQRPVAVRLAPSTNAAFFRGLAPGSRVELFEWDHTRRWRRITMDRPKEEKAPARLPGEGEQPDYLERALGPPTRKVEVQEEEEPLEQDGWVLIEHPEFGQLLRAVDPRLEEGPSAKSAEASGHPVLREVTSSLQMNTLRKYEENFDAAWGMRPMEGPVRGVKPGGKSTKTDDSLAALMASEARPELEEPLLMRACRAGNYEAARALLFRGADANACDVLGETALVEAASSSRADLVAMLLLRKADPLRASSGGYTSLLSMAEDTPCRALIQHWQEGSSSEPDLQAALWQLDPRDAVAVCNHLGVDMVQEPPAPAPAAVLATPATPATPAAPAAPVAAPVQAEPSVPEAPSCPPTRHRVVYKKVAVREHPDTKARSLRTKRQGDLVDMFEWDASQRWRRVQVQAEGANGDLCTMDGWMLLHSEEIGPLLEVEEDAPASDSDDDPGAG
ncbi:unnamed protein product [Effrenium voratum]|nr:unnamed protein product [Effrenium voratum]